MPGATHTTVARKGRAGHTQGLACLCPQTGCRTPRYSPAPCQSLGEQHVSEELTNQRLATPWHEASPGSTKDGQMPFRSSMQSHTNWFIWWPTDVERKKSFGVGEQGNMTSSTNKAETSCVNKACPLADLNHNSCGDLNQCSLVLSYSLKNIPYILFTQN